MQPNRRKSDFVYLPSPEALRIQRQRNRVTQRMAARRVARWCLVWLAVLAALVLVMMVVAP